MTFNTLAGTEQTILQVQSEYSPSPLLSSTLTPQFRPRLLFSLLLPGWLSYQWVLSLML